MLRLVKLWLVLLILFTVGCSDVQLSSARRDWLQSQLEVQQEVLIRLKKKPAHVCGDCAVGSLTENDIILWAENNAVTFQILLDADAEGETEVSNVSR